MCRILCFVLVCLSLTSPLHAVSLQRLIDETPEGGALTLAPETYYGSIVINKPLTLDGQGSAILDGEGTGSVITLQANGVILKNLKITNSGDSHDQVNAGITVLSSSNQILNNTIDNTLFGIELRESHDNQIMGNEISSKDRELGLRGDAVRVWASHRNTFRHNRIYDSRDMVIWYSNENIIEENEGWNNRYGLHFMYTGKNYVRHNRYHHNTVGIFLMYSKDSILEHNDIRYSSGGIGMGIGMKEVDNMTIRFNTIVYSTMGIYLDQSPHDPWAFNLIQGNQIGYNVTGVVLHSTLRQNVFKGNALVDNLSSVDVHANGTGVKNIWEGNYWSDYEGFDRDNNGYGDSAYEDYRYLGQLWLNHPWTKFYFGSPVVSVINFLSKLLPISEPHLLVRDENPVFQVTSGQLLSEENIAFEIPDEDDDYFDDDDYYEDDEEI